MCACPLIGGSSHSHEPSNQRNSSLQRGRLEWVLMSLTQPCRRFGKRLMGTRSNNQIHLDFFATVPSVSVYRILAFLRLLVVLSNTINTSLILAVLGQMLNNDPSTERCWPALSHVEPHTSQNLSWAQCAGFLGVLHTLDSAQVGYWMPRQLPWVLWATLEWWPVSRTSGESSAARHVHRAEIPLTRDWWSCGWVINTGWWSRASHWDPHLGSHFDFSL